ncbi:4'-phosphopantetheinyl transferase family protein [Bradyrhizobium sp. HKCCYLS2038]|uniref:4'-phosphopantetheinyl transferase family protein n=1 Tax=unclassified Bradyrhizobium TaxID=2631580 RepID=UPI003EBE6D59
MSDASETIAVRAVSLDGVADGEWLALVELLDADERERASGFVFDRHRRQFVVAHAIKRLMICSVTGVPPSSLRFGKTAAGKPWLMPAGRPYFSISHCDAMVACALSSTLEIGIDVEPLDRTAPLELADFYCSPGERRWLADLTPADRSHGFMKMWTLKEAVLKAAGCGLDHPLKELSVEIDPPAVAISNGILVTADRWHVRHHCVGPRHSLALAWRGQAAEVKLASGDLRSMISEISR